MSAPASSCSTPRSPENSAAPPTLTAFLRGDRIGAEPLDSQMDVLGPTVDVHYAELCRLLQMDAQSFWKEVARTSSLHLFVDRYLKVSDRVRYTRIAGALTRRDDLERQLLRFLHRISSNSDDCIDSEQHSALLQEKKWLDLPKLMEISALYVTMNPPMIRDLVANAIRLQPNILDDVHIALSYFLSTVNTFYQNCMASFEMLASSLGDGEVIKDELEDDLLEMEEFIDYAVVTMNRFIEAYKPAAILLFSPSKTSNQTENLLNLLGRMHDSLFPLFKLELPDFYEYLNLRCLHDEIVKLGRNILVICFLTANAFGESFGNRPITTLFPAMVDDPATRGDIIFQTLLRVNEEILPRVHHIEGHKTLLKSIELGSGLVSRIRVLREKGWMFLDDKRFSYLSAIMMPPSIKPGFFDDEDDAVMESKIPEDYEGEKIAKDVDNAGGTGTIERARL